MHRRGFSRVPIHHHGPLQMIHSQEPLRAFAVAAPGLEDLLAAELVGLGIPARPVPGGAEWEGDLAGVRVANLHSRLATRVLVRVAEFRARSFHELERHAGRIPWEVFVEQGRQLHLRVSCSKSRLYHEGAVAERLMRAATAAVGAVQVAAAAGDDDSESAEDVQLVVVRFLHDRCTVSVDSSGAPLYMRGYRKALARAPLRETLAAAILVASEWDPATALLDPMCGSGTIPIEAALIARRIAPGIANRELNPRAFSFERWPGHDADAWKRETDAARAKVLDRADAPILASDRDAGAVRAAVENAERAGVRADLTIERAALTTISPPAAPGWLLSNPPYGLRVSERTELRNLYAALGRLARDSLPGWHIGILSADPRLAGQLRLPLREVLRTRNGGIPVSLMIA
jgi:putative N6-adenine-specific DNA methylase